MEHISANTVAAVIVMARELDRAEGELRAFIARMNEVNQTGFTGEPKARKVSYGKGKPWEPFFDRGARTCGAHGLGE